MHVIVIVGLYPRRNKHDVDDDRCYELFNVSKFRGRRFGIRSYSGPIYCKLQEQTLVTVGLFWKLAFQSRYHLCGVQMFHLVNIWQQNLIENGFPSVSCTNVRLLYILPRGNPGAPKGPPSWTNPIVTPLFSTQKFVFWGGDHRYDRRTYVIVHN